MTPEAAAALVLAALGLVVGAVPLVTHKTVAEIARDIAELLRPRPQPDMFKDQICRALRRLAWQGRVEWADARRLATIIQQLDVNDLQVLELLDDPGKVKKRARGGTAAPRLSASALVTQAIPRLTNPRLAIEKLCHHQLIEATILPAEMERAPADFLKRPTTLSGRHVTQAIALARSRRFPSPGGR